jgi:hypothetical protein
MNSILLLSVLTMLLLAINLPLGYVRNGHERFAYGWYFYLYLSLPAVVYLKAKIGYEWKFIPVLLCGAVFGQILGGLLAQHRREEPKTLCP